MDDQAGDIDGWTEVGPPVDVVYPPIEGLWRVARVTDPLAPSRCRDAAEESNPHAGNRFDTTGFGVIYFGSSRACCYGETLARFRPDPSLAALVAEDWAAFMAPGQMPADWRSRRTAVLAEVPISERFVDVESMRTRSYLQEGLALGLAALGVTDLDVAAIRGSDRRITRLISRWAYNAVDEEGEPYFAGIRYLSRLNSDWECWAAFEDVAIESTRATSIEASDDELRAVSGTFGINIH